tara:strand:+ start:556 stop:750 length:195 start_codon:yes stop_codon:yes gene_type:complete
LSRFQNFQTVFLPFLEYNPLFCVPKKSALFTLCASAKPEIAKMSESQEQTACAIENGSGGHKTA